MYYRSVQEVKQDLKKMCLKIISHPFFDVPEIIFLEMIEIVKIFVVNDFPKNWEGLNMFIFEGVKEAIACIENDPIELI